MDFLLPVSGRTCREDIDECVSQPCFPGVDCNNTMGSFVCGFCPSGYSGDGKNCTRRSTHWKVFVFCVSSVNPFVRALNPSLSTNVWFYFSVSNFQKVLNF